MTPLSRWLQHRSNGSSGALKEKAGLFLLGLYLSQQFHIWARLLWWHAPITADLGNGHGPLVLCNGNISPKPYIFLTNVKVIIRLHRSRSGHIISIPVQGHYSKFPSYLTNLLNRAMVILIILLSSFVQYRAMLDGFCINSVH